MAQVLKQLTRAALATLLLMTVARSLPFLAASVPREFISKAQAFALFHLLLLAMALLAFTVILRERTAARFDHARRRDVDRMLRWLSMLALLAAAVGVDRALPYLTADASHDDVSPLATTLVALALASWWLLAHLRGRLRSPKGGTVALLRRMLASGGQAGCRSWIRVLKKLTTAMLLALTCFPLLSLAGKITGHGFVSMSIIVAPLATLALAWRLMRAKPPARGGEGGSAGMRIAAVMAVTDAVAPAPQTEPRHMGRVLWKLAHAASVAVLIVVAGILPLLTGRVTGADVFFIALVFVLFVFLVLAQTLLVLAVVCRNVPGTLDLEKAALVAAMALMAFAMSMVAYYIIVGAILEV